MIVNVKSHILVNIQTNYSPIFSKNDENITFKAA